mgnify:CR=1 FL=1
MKKFLGSILFIVYVVIVITVTILLLSYNEYMCSEINGYTLYIVTDESLEPNYVKGDLIAIAGGASILSGNHGHSMNKTIGGILKI